MRKAISGKEIQKNVFKLVAALKQCGKTRNLEGGKSLHAEAAEAGFHTDKYVSTALVVMYSKCGSMSVAQEVFNSTKDKDVVLWTSLISGYVENGESLVALDMLAKMECKPNAFTFAAAAKACASLAASDKSKTEFCLERGKAIHQSVRELGLLGDVNVSRRGIASLKLESGKSLHAETVEAGLHTDKFVSTALVVMYSKCGSMSLAQEVFNNTKDKDVVLWTSLITEYVENGESLAALDMLAKMDCQPNAFTFASAATACASLAASDELKREFCLERGKAIHQTVRELGLLENLITVTALIDMYSKCGSMKEAREIFEGMRNRNVVTWTSLIQGYVDNGQCATALELFTGVNCQPDLYLFVAGLNACVGVATENDSDRQSCLEKGLAIQKQVEAHGFESDILIASKLMKLYRKCGSIPHAKEVFDKMRPPKDVVIWTCMILAYVESGENSAAIDLFNSMDCTPDGLAYVAALKAYGGLAALATGRRIHATVCKLGLEEDHVVTTALVDFYGRCGCMSNAVQLFSWIRSPEVAAWNALIGGYSRLGKTLEACTVAEKAIECGIQVDAATFALILTACSHAGEVEKGSGCFDAMVRCGVTPNLEHYICMVDLFGRANRLDEALGIIKSMPFEPDEVTWTSLLGACRKWNNLTVGRIAFDALLASGSKQVAHAYVLMADIYGRLGMWQHKEELECSRKTQEGWENARTEFVVR